MLKPFRFIGRDVKRVILAPSLQAARNYVDVQGLTVHSYRRLTYVGMGHPSDPTGWIATTVPTPDTRPRFRQRRDDSLIRSIARPPSHGRLVVIGP
jgi:hypothetical protein